MGETPSPTPTTNDPDEFCLYMEKSSNIIYEVKFVSDYVMARPATPALYHMIRKMTIPEFLNEFEESYIDVQKFRSRTTEVKIRDQD